MLSKLSVFALFCAAVLAADESPLSKLPECAQPCFADAFPKSGCPMDKDYVCLCKSQIFIDEVAACTIRQCKKKDQDKVQKKVTEACGDLGIHIFNQ